MTETATQQPRRFETTTCTRCGGSGRYSYCQMHGSTCFKCGSSGRQYTARGAAAAAWLTARKTKKAKDVEFGEWVSLPGVPGFSRPTYFTLERTYTRLNSGSYSVTREFGPETVYCKHLYLEGTSPAGETLGIGTFPDADVRIIVTKARARELLTEALDYQDTLTKAGTPRKRPASTGGHHEN